MPCLVVSAVGSNEGTPALVCGDSRTEETLAKGMMMPLLDNDFYPTPDEVIDRMVKPYLVDYVRYGEVLAKVDKVLEPSAGWGHICERLTDRYRLNTRNLRCIEKSEESRHILMGKGFTVVDTDFLQYEPEEEFSHIIMNPPFSMGCAHILKAWRVLKHGHIACLLNANTIRNPNSRARQTLAKIVADHGRVEYIGRPFADAERPTNVECCIVWLEKKSRASESTNFSGMESDVPLPETEFEGNFLARPDMIQTLVDQFNAAKQVLIEIEKSESKFQFYTKGIVASHSQSDMITKNSLEEKITALKHKFWGYVFDKTKIGAQVTSRFRDKFEQYEQGTRSLAFSVPNITNVLMSFIENADEILKECVLEVFDMLTKYHKENREHVEGWVSNHSWKVTERVVLPWAIKCDRYGSYVSYSFNYNMEKSLDDLDRVLCHLSQRKLEEITRISYVAKRHIDFLGQRPVRWSGFSDEIESTFFRIRIYKKGTIHLRIKDRDLWDRFNIRAADGKGWLPGPS